MDDYSHYSNLLSYTPRTNNWKLINILQLGPKLNTPKQVSYHFLAGYTSYVLHFVTLFSFLTTLQKDARNGSQCFLTFLTCFLAPLIVLLVHIISVILVIYDVNCVAV